MILINVFFWNKFKKMLINQVSHMLSDLMVVLVFGFVSFQLEADVT